jgi:hypothetical protein
MNFLITTIAGGNLYLNFAAIYIYSLKKAYPNYDIKIYSWDKIPKNISDILKSLDLEDCLIEKDFYGINKSIKNIKAMRWLYQYKDIKNYDHVFTGDIDFCMIEEKPSLLDQHLKFCEMHNLPYSNRVRARSYRLGGLHFYKVQEYYDACGNIIDDFRKKLINNDYSIFRHPNSTLEIYDGDEELLYQIIEKSGLGFPKNIKTKRLHHGIHLKRKYSIDLAAKENELLLYKKCFIDMYNNDEYFIEILNKISKEAKSYIDKCYLKLK